MSDPSAARAPARTSARPSVEPAAARAGVAYTENPNSRAAGAEAAREALERAGLDRADLVLAFQTSKHDPHAFHAGVRSVVGEDARLVGGYAAGIITNHRLGYEGHQAGVAVISAPSMRMDVLVEGDLRGRGPEAAGVSLGRRLRDVSFDGDPNLLLFYDAIKENVDDTLHLNMATPLLQGMSEGMGVSLREWPPTSGVGMMGDMQWNETWQFLDGEVKQQTATALCLSGGVRMDTVIMHGCKPAGRYYKVTRTDGPVLLELEGRPALEVMGEVLGDRSSWEEYPMFLTLGLNKGDKFEEFREENWANRLCMSIDRERGGLVMFEPDLKEGMEVTLMRRSIDFDYIGERARSLLERTEGRRPFFALYIDCVGRAAAYCGMEAEEAEEVQKALGDIPLFGFYSGVEIAQVGGEVQALDWTGVLCVFSEGDQPGGAR
jgi:hypothetical protein